MSKKTVYIFCNLVFVLMLCPFRAISTEQEAKEKLFEQLSRLEISLIKATEEVRPLADSIREGITGLETRQCKKKVLDSLDKMMSKFQTETLRSAVPDLANYKKNFFERHVFPVSVVLLLLSIFSAMAFLMFRKRYNNLLDELLVLDNLIAEQSEECEETKRLLEEKEVNFELINDNLTEAYHSAIIANELKDRFISVLAHDIRSPLSTLVSSCNLLDTEYDKFAPERAKQMISYAASSGANLLKMIDDLLQWSRAVSDRHPFNPDTYDLHHICSEVFTLMQPDAQKKGITLYLGVAEGIYAFCDATMVRTVIRNLVSNAIKFTEQSGSISIWCREKDANSVLVGVTDDGIGMDEETQFKVLEPNRTFSSDGTGGEKGTGFGIALCTEFIEKHNSELHLESQKGFGTTFSFELERRNAPENPIIE